MGTRAVVAVPYGDGSWRGRYVHWDGAPQSLGRVLWALLHREGLRRVVEVVTEEHYGWSSLDGRALQQERGEGFQTVPGWGTAYTAAHGIGPGDWFGPDDLAPAWVEWVYVLTRDGILTFQVDPDGSTRTYAWSPQDGQAPMEAHRSLLPEGT